MQTNKSQLTGRILVILCYRGRGGASLCRECVAFWLGRHSCRTKLPPNKIYLVDISDIFYFFCSGEGKGVRGARKGVRGVGFLLKITGGGARREGEGGGGPRGWEGVCGELEGGGAKYFFPGPKFPPSLSWYEKWFEKREKGSEKRSETCPKTLKDISPALF